MHPSPGPLWVWDSEGLDTKRLLPAGFLSSHWTQRPADSPQTEAGLCRHEKGTGTCKNVKNEAHVVFSVTSRMLRWRRASTRLYPGN